jgi:hypothetical protein
MVASNLASFNYLESRKTKSVLDTSCALPFSVNVCSFSLQTWQKVTKVRTNLEYLFPMLLHNPTSSKYGTSVTAATDFTMCTQIKKGHAVA